jgi:hypothetical protein
MSKLNARARVETGAIIVTVVGFLLLFAAAARAYPGGTHFDHTSIGHDFWRNTLCDVARTVAIDGAPNASACTLARIAMTLLAVGLGVLFVALPRLFPSRARLGRAVRVLGVATIPFAIAVVFLPTDRFGQLHGLAIFVAGVLGLSTVLLALKGLFSDARVPPLVVALGVVSMSVAAVDLALYLLEFLSGGPAQLAVPILERVATFLLLGWMLAVARAIRATLRVAPCLPFASSPSTTSTR